eukprot:scaffold7.g3630.t1
MARLSQPAARRAHALPRDECIVLATSEGFLQLHAPDGQIILRQELHDAPATGVGVRGSGAGLDPGDRSQDLTLAFADAFVYIACWEVWAAVRWHAGRRRGGGWFDGTSSPPHITFSKWLLPKGTGPRTHAACLGPQQPPLYSLLTARHQHVPPRLQFLTAGARPPLACCLVEEGGGPGVLSLAAGLARATASSLLGTARGYLPFSSSHGGAQARAAARGGGGSGEAQQQGTAQGRGKREKIPGEQAPISVALWDDKRAIACTALSPSGSDPSTPCVAVCATLAPALCMFSSRWAACCDNLGRVLLVDAASTLVLRVLKGYRSAQAAWLVVPGRRTSARTPAHSAAGSATSLGGGSEGGAASGEEGRQQQEQLRQQQQQEQEQLEQQQEKLELAEEEEERLFLVIYAPRRAALEVWQPGAGRRVGSLPCAAQHGLLVGQSLACEAGSCWLLDLEALTLADLTPQLAALVA